MTGTAIIKETKTMDEEQVAHLRALAEWRGEVEAWYSNRVNALLEGRGIDDSGNVGPPPPPPPPGH
jgi:hypothetical protein